MNLTDNFRNDASLTCTIQRPTAFETLTLAQVEEEGTNATMLTTNVTMYLVCNIDYEHMQQLWQILAMYSDTPLRLGRGLMLTRSPAMIYKYSQIKAMDGEEGGDGHIEADIKASPAWLMQGEVNFQLDRTMTTFSTLHIMYQSEVTLRVESKSTKRESYSWTMIKRDNQTKTEHTVLAGGVAQLSCQVMGEPKPLLEWILPDGSKIRAPYSSEDRRIIITADGKLTIRGVDSSDTGLYRCIATNYLDADVLIFRVTVLTPDLEEEELSGVQLSKPHGGNVIFDCSSSGSPKPSVSWILPDHSILEKSHGNRKLYENGTLQIQGLTTRDQGFYKCLVANQLGVDLLVSQVKVEEPLETETTINSHESGLIKEFNPADNLDDITSSSLADRTSQESRTIKSDRPYPRHRLQGRGNPGDTLGQRRRGAVRNRQFWSNRVFEKTSRKVDPQRFADFVKKAQGLSKKKTDKEDKKINKDNSPFEFSGDDENGSGEVHLNNVPSIVTQTTKYPHRKHSQANKSETTHTHEHVDFENASKEINSDETTESYMQSDSTSLRSGFTLIPRFTESPIPEGVSSPPANINPFTLQFSVTNTSQETQIQFSGEPSLEHERSAGAMQSVPTDSNVTLMKNEQGPVEMVIHTDHDSQTLLTAFTTTEKTEDEITFHTTQTIKAPRLPPGSTIISRQQIHVIPRKNNRGRGRGRKTFQGRRKTFQGRRRIIKPNRITDIQSFINKLKQPTIKTEGNVSVPYGIKLITDGVDNEDNKKTEEDLQVVTPTASSSQLGSTQKTTVSFAKFFISSTPPFTQPESRSEIYSLYARSPGAPEFSTFIDRFLTTKKEPLIPTTNPTTTSTMASTTLNRRIPLNRRFGSRERDKSPIRLNRPLSTHQPILTDGTTTFTRTITHSPISSTTPSSLAQDVTFITQIPTQSKESTIYNDYGESSSAEFITMRPSFQNITTTSSTRTTMSSTTSNKNPDLHTLPVPPTVIAQSKENPDEYLSGSGGLLDSLYVVTQRPLSRKGHQARRRNFGDRRPYKKPGIKNMNPTTKLLDSSVPLTMKGTTMEPTTKPQRTVSRYKEDKNSLFISINPPLMTELDMEEEWTSGVYPVYTTEKTPPITSVTYKPTLERTYSTAQTLVLGTFRPPTKRNYDNTTDSGIERNISPPMQSPEGRTHEPFPAGQLTTHADMKNNNIYTQSQYIKNIDNVISTEDNTDNQVASDFTTVFEATTKVMRNKPKIVGGNAASFTVLSDSDAFMPCEASGNPQPVITWKRFISNTGNTITIKGKMGKIEVSINGTLSIKNANIKDRGQYLCVAENDYGSDKLLVTLTVVAYPPHILEPKVREIKSHSGHTVEMKCNAEGRPLPMISWILANQTQVRGVNSQRGRVSVSGVGTLIIKSVTVYDRGHYKCIASNPAGVDTATVRLQVVAAPPGIVEEKRQHLNAQSNQPLWLPCTGHGTPNPSVHWVLHDGSVLRVSRPSSYTKIFMYRNGTLFFKDVTPAESGKYECIATSSTGSERRVVTLVVEKQELAPKILKKSPRKTNLSFGDQLQLDCSATGEPEPTIIWRLPSKAVVDHWHRTSSRIQVLENWHSDC
uniref:Ig-like domain-containing protein n=1 Tax=Gouania willdenowi TaxID=441366 RepID=A0A8C5HZ48_GOUWI